MKKTITITMILFSLINFNLFAEDKTFVVSPTSLKDQLLTKNMTLLQALNNVENSKLNVSMARAKLLPSLNLTILLPALSNPSFLLSSVNLLFPFLVPSNWTTLKQQKELFEADKASYKSIQLNVYSNALTLYYTYLNDLKIQKVYQDQSVLLERMYSALKRQSDVLGNVTSEDLEMSKAQLEDAKIKISKLAELLVEEKASIRTMLGLPLGTNIELNEIDLTPSTFEGKSAQEISDYSISIAPESTQLDYLIKASKLSKFSKIFGFMSNASMSGTSSNGSSPFDNLKVGGGFTFGADNLVNLKISDNNMEQLELRKTALTEENQKVSEIVSSKMDEIKSQLEMGKSSLNSRLKVFEGQKKQFELGLISLQNLLQTESLLTDTKVNNLRIDFDFKMQRLNLQRLVIDGEFKTIKGCQDNSQSESESKHSLFGLKKKKEVSLDELCQN